MIPSTLRPALFALLVGSGTACSLRSAVSNTWHGARLRAGQRALERLPVEELGPRRAEAVALVGPIRAHGAERGLRRKTRAPRLLTTAHWEPEVLVSCPPLALQPTSPPLGGSPWQLHLSPRSLLREVRRRELSGDEVHHRPAGAWTSWGLGPAPLLPSALDRSPGALAELILHEAVHHTFWLRGRPALAEGLAGFLGRALADDFLAAHFGPESDELLRHREETAETDRWAALLVRVNTDLQAILADPQTSPEAKLRARSRVFGSLHERVESAGFLWPERFHAAVDAGGWTTARLLEHQAYVGLDQRLQALLDARSGDLAQLIADLHRWQSDGELVSCLESTPPCS
jgi:hypothetical protein